MDLIVEAREHGVNVSVETCPQYLVMDTSDLEQLAGFASCAPPLRHPELVEMMWDFVLDEAVDVIASDHWAFTSAAKEVGAANIFDAPNGLPGVQTLFPLMYDAAVALRGMPPDALVRLMAANPARIFGLYPRKGTITVGSDADLVLFDPQATWTIANRDLRHRQQWTPYAGRTLKGRVLRTIRRGETVFDVTRSGAEQVLDAHGSGRFLPRA
jgi:allantoinase